MLALFYNNNKGTIYNQNGTPIIFNNLMLYFDNNVDHGYSGNSSSFKAELIKEIFEETFIEELGISKSTIKIIDVNPDLYLNCFFDQFFEDHDFLRYSLAEGFDAALQNFD